MKTKWAIIIFVLIAFILYGKSINHQYNIDDNYVVHNHELVKKGIKGIPDIFKSRYHNERDQAFGYRPFTIAVFALETSVFGQNPRIHHTINILLYALLVIVLFRLLKQLMPKISDSFIFLGLLIFIVHPIHTEVVLSLKNREEIFCFFFGALAWKQAIRYYDKQKVYSIILSILFLVISFLSKETAIVFLAIIPISLFFFRVKASENNETMKAKPNKSPWLIGIQVICFLLIAFQFDFITSIIGSTLYNVIAFVTITSIAFTQCKFNDFRHSPILKTSIGLLVLTIIISILFKGLGKVAIAFTSLSLILYTVKHQFPNRFMQWKKGIKAIPKVYLYSILFTIISALVIAAVFYIPETLLPKQNAPVFHWQNPLFAEHSVSTHLGIVLYSLAFYLKLLFIPHPLRFYYGFAVIPDVGIFHPISIISLLIHLLLMYMVYRGIKKRSILSFSILIYFIGILPFSNIFFPLTGIIAERLLFIPSLGFSLAMAFLIFKISKTDIYSNKPIIKQAGIIALSLIIVIPFSTLSIQRTPDWENRETLYEADIPNLTKSAKANNLYANHLIAKVYEGMKHQVPLQQMDEIIQLSIKHYNQTLIVDSTYANAYHNLGYIYMIIGRDYNTAERYFTGCIERDTTIPEAYMNRGVCRFYLKKYDESLSDLESSKSFNMEKEMDKIFYYSGQIYEIKGEYEKAIEAYDSALFYNPSQANIIEKQAELNRKLDTINVNSR